MKQESVYCVVTIRFTHFWHFCHLSVHLQAAFAAFLLVPGLVPYPSPYCFKSVLHSLEWNSGNKDGCRPHFSSDWWEKQLGFKPSPSFPGLSMEREQGGCKQMLMWIKCSTLLVWSTLEMNFASAHTATSPSWVTLIPVWLMVEPEPSTHTR